MDKRWAIVEGFDGAYRVSEMTEQGLRAAVAEYDAELARDMESSGGGLRSSSGEVQWCVCEFSIRRESAVYTQDSETFISHAATMRAMDAAAKAFEEALK